MDQKLLNQRAYKKNEEISKRRSYFMQNVLQNEVDATTQKFREMYQMIVGGKIMEQDEGMFLSELVLVVRYDSKENEVGQYMGTVMQYLIKIFQKTKPQEKEYDKVNNILNVLNNITFFISDISPYQREIFEIAQQCMAQIHYSKNAIILLTNLSSFNIYQQMMQYMSSQKFLLSFLKIIQDNKLEDEQKSKIVDVFSNLLLDSNSNKQDLCKNIILLQKIIQQNSDTEIVFKIIACLKSLIKINKSIIDDLCFQSIVINIFTKSFDITDSDMKTQFLDLLRIIVKKSHPQLVQSLLEKGLLDFILTYENTQSQNEHNTIVKILINIIYVIQKIQALKHLTQSKQLYKIILFYLKQYYNFSFPSLKQSILQMVIKSEIQKIINTPQLNNFIQSFMSSSQTLECHKKILIFFCYIIDIQDISLLLQTKIIKLLQNILKTNENNTIKNKVLKLLQYIEQNQQ